MQAGAVLAGGNGVSLEEEGEPLQVSAESREVGKNQCIRGLGRPGKPNICVGSLVLLAPVKGGERAGGQSSPSLEALLRFLPAGLGAHKPSAFHAPHTPNPHPFPGHSLLLPPPGIGFGNDPGWDLEVVPWNPSDGHPGYCREVGCAGWSMRPRNPILTASFLGIISSKS